jgi:transposase
MPELHSFVRLSGFFAQSSARCWCISRETRSETFVWQQLPQHARLPDHTFGHVGQRTQIINAIRAHMGEFGIVVAKGIQNIERLIAAARNVPEAARAAVDMLADQLQGTQDRIDAVTVRIAESQADDPLARRLATAPGVGAISSSAFAATTPDVSAFRSGRDYAAWLGLTPCAHSSGGKERLGRISKAGNRYLRRLLYLGAMAWISARRRRRAVASDATPDWLDRMLERKPVKVVAIALANRMARTIWALIRGGESYRNALA